MFWNVFYDVYKCVETCLEDVCGCLWMYSKVFRDALTMFINVLEILVEVCRCLDVFYKCFKRVLKVVYIHFECVSRCFMRI